MSPPRTIAWVIKGDEGYGVRACVLGLAMGVREAGARPVFASLEDGAFARELREAGLPIVVVGCGSPRTLSGSIANRVRIACLDAAAAKRRGREVALALKPLEPDVVHVVWPNLVSIAGRAARLLGKPCFWEMPNIIGTSLPMGLNARIYRNLCRKLDVFVLANSRYTGSTYGTGAAAPTTFYPATDSTRFDPERVPGRSRASLAIPDNAIVFTIVARISESKGQRRFFEGLLRLRGSDTPPCHLLLLGGPTDGADAMAMRAAAAKAGCPEVLHFAGVVGDAETYYPMSDVGVNSRVDPEPYGLSVIESMLMQRPVLVHALGGPAETVLDGSTGWHCQDTSPEGWERAVRRVLADRPKWPAMGRAAREHALRNFTTQRVAARYLSLVDQRLTRGTRASTS